MPQAPVLDVELSGEPARQYLAGPEDRSNSVLASRLEQSLPGIQVVACLERAAATYARASATQGERLPLAFAEFVLHWAGCPDPSTAVSTMLTDRDDPEALADNLVPMIDEGGFTHIGAARVPADAPYRWRWVVFLVGRHFRLSAAPTSVEPGADYPLQLRLDPSFHHAEVVVTEPRGVIREHAVGLSNGWAVASVPMASEVGREWVEVVAEAADGPRVIALFPVEVGRRSPRRWVGPARVDESWVESTEQAEAVVESLVAEDRERFGLEPLVADPLLVEIARNHSADMAATRYLAHVSEASGSVVDRLRAAGYGVRFAAENLARGAVLADAHEGLMRSPGHRAAVLSRDATHVGIGVVQGTAVGGERVYYITQIFARPAAVADPESLTRAVAARIRERRSQMGLAAAEHSQGLGLVAQRIAAAMARQGLAAADIDSFISGELQKLDLHGVRWRLVFGEAFEAADVELPVDLDEQAPPMVGVGVAQPTGGGRHLPATYALLVVHRS